MLRKCARCKTAPTDGRAWCDNCHQIEMAKAHAGESEPIGSEEETERTESGLGPSGGALSTHERWAFQRGVARNGRVFKNEKSIQ